MDASYEAAVDAVPRTGSRSSQRLLAALDLLDSGGDLLLDHLNLYLELAQIELEQERERWLRIISARLLSGTCLFCLALVACLRAVSHFMGQPAFHLAASIALALLVLLAAGAELYRRRFARHGGPLLAALRSELERDLELLRRSS
jgi:uncharacterized membrane protein YqjE